MAEINKELFQKIHDQIMSEPETHDQSTWEYINQCGTTRCVAGWAIALHSGMGAYDYMAELGDPGYGIPSIAEGLLGLTVHEGHRLFHCGDDEAQELVLRYATKGREE